jgi:hypothetical protein
MNINRWRGQIGLAPIEESDLAKTIQRFEVGGTEGSFVDLEGQDQRIVAVAAARPDGTWFIKMKGPKELAEKHKAEFEAFIRSVKFAP